MTKPTTCPHCQCPTDIQIGPHDETAYCSVCGWVEGIGRPVETDPRVCPPPQPARNPFITGHRAITPAVSERE